MKILIMMLLVYTISSAKVFYSKVEPYEVRAVSSDVSGLVVYTNEDMIGKVLTSKEYIRIDSKLDSVELKYLEDKLEYLKEIVSVNGTILLNLDKSLKRKRESYKRVESLTTMSIADKDREYNDLISSENQFLNTQKEIYNLKVQITDLNLRKAQLIRNIEDKTLSAKGFVLYSILVKPGQVVAKSTPLAEVADVSKAKLTIYLDEIDVLEADNKVVYIDGFKTDYKISRILNISDSKNISKYMAQIIIDSPKVFSKVVKVELKAGDSVE